MICQTCTTKWPLESILASLNIKNMLNKETIRDRILSLRSTHRHGLEIKAFVHGRWKIARFGIWNILFFTVQTCPSCHLEKDDSYVDLYWGDYSLIKTTVNRAKKYSRFLWSTEEGRKCRAQNHREHHDFEKNRLAVRGRFGLSRGANMSRTTPTIDIFNKARNQ